MRNKPLCVRVSRNDKLRFKPPRTADIELADRKYGKANMKHLKKIV